MSVRDIITVEVLDMLLGDLPDASEKPLGYRLVMPWTLNGRWFGTVGFTVAGRPRSDQLEKLEYVWVYDSVVGLLIEV